MRTRLLLFVTALLACRAWPAGAQQATGQQPGEQMATPTPWNITLANWFDGGVRVTDVSDDRARFERFRDPRTGPFLGRFRFQKETGPGTFSLGVDNAGYRDQRFAGQFTAPGKVKLSVEWNQVPQFWSIDTRTPYSGVGSADQRLPAGLQAAVQGGQTVVSTYNALALDPFDTRASRDTFTVNFLYTATPNLDVNFHLSSARRTGEQPWSMSFGFGQTVEVAAPVDTRTTDLDVGAEWANDRGMLRVNYNGSWFNNSDESLTIDNPLRAADAPGGAMRGRQALWPSNSANTVTGAGSIRLPGRSRLAATVAIGNWKQDAPLLPITTNTAIATDPLPRASLQGDIRRITTNINFTTRPASYLGINARYRLYDFDDQTPEFAPPQIVQYDAAAETGDEFPIFNHRYNTFDVDATITSLRAFSVTGGYRLERVKRTERAFGLTTENGFHASIDSANIGLVSLHGIFEHSRRRGSDYDEPFLLESGEYPGLRRFDIADRNTNRATAMVQVMPTPTIAVSGSVTAEKDDFLNRQFGKAEWFGLQDRNSQGYAVLFDAAPREAVTVGAGVGYQIYKTSQQSRRTDIAPTVPPNAQQTDPRRNWSVAENERAVYVAANAEMTNLFPKTAVRVTWDYNRARSPYNYAVAPDTTLTPVVALPPGTTWPVRLPPLVNRWHTITADVRYFVRKNLAAGVTYWADIYRVDDAWSMGSAIENRTALPGILLLGYGYRPYTANSIWLRVLYIF